MAMRRFCCLIDAGVTPTARSRNHVAWSKRDTYICEFMWLVKSYSEASTAPLKVCTHSAMLCLSLFAVSYQPSAFSLQNQIRVIRGDPRPVFDFRHKLCHLLQRRRLLIAMRRVPAVRQHQDLRVWNPRPNRFHLRRRTVLVFLALNAQHRTANGIEIRLDVPRAKARIEPNVVPSPERLVHMCMIAAELDTKVSRFVRDFCRRDAGDAEILYEHMRSFQHQRSCALRITAREDQRDRSAIAVTQQNRLQDAELLQQVRQHHFALVMHKLHRTLLRQLL